MDYVETKGPTNAKALLYQKDNFRRTIAMNSLFAAKGRTVAPDILRQQCPCPVFP
jgi:hypothetical protein